MFCVRYHTIWKAPITYWYLCYCTEYNMFLTAATRRESELLMCKIISLFEPFERYRKFIFRFFSHIKINWNMFRYIKILLFILQYYFCCKCWIKKLGPPNPLKVTIFMHTYVKLENDGFTRHDHHFNKEWIFKSLYVFLVDDYVIISI